MSVKSEKWKRENSFFLNPKTNRVQYNSKCSKCDCNCKQSFKATVCFCPYYTPKAKGVRQ